ncbi:hypothetical protein BFW38_02640 [Terasakiispira papahanaumokuakeensis]|uniref:DUF2946 domain-containing protein n=2 Tax=Terasakiispira papahanaumokuakeensis TaxID=197479 RepID=A0A1E2V6H1_9GAMM|nr:hypothetical protein BFW38_02640 [Terasakiispira papahanaumokuakeensis]
MRLSQRYHYHAVGLSLLAVLMLYLGPLYSQLTRPAPMPSGMVMAHQFSAQQQSTSTDAVTHTLVQPHHAGDHHSHLSHLEACGYCSLLFHLSWMQALAIPLVTTQVPSLPLPAVRHASADEADVYSSSYPRAPPHA